MEKRAKFLELKPFSKEKDDTRKFDLLRSLVLFMGVRDHPNKTKNAIAGAYFWDFKISMILSNVRNLFFLIFSKKILRKKFAIYEIIHEIKNFPLAKIKRLRAFGYYSLLQPLKQKYASQNLEELAKFGKCNIKIWFQPKRAKEPELISKSATTYLHDLNFVTKMRYHPYSNGRLQLDMDDLKSTIYNSQSSKIVKMKIWEAIEQNFKISKTEFVEQWGTSISIEKELEFQEKFGRGFNVYSNLNANFYTAEKIYSSMFPAFSFIVNPCDGENFDVELEVTVILSDSYLRPFHCEATENCSYTVKKVLYIWNFSTKIFLNFPYM